MTLTQLLELASCVAVLPHDKMNHLAVSSVHGQQVAELILNPAVLTALVDCVEAADWVTGQHVSGISLTESREAYRAARARLDAALRDP